MAFQCIACCCDASARKLIFNTTAAWFEIMSSFVAILQIRGMVHTYCASECPGRTQVFNARLPCQRPWVAREAAEALVEHGCPWAPGGDKRRSGWGCWNATCLSGGFAKLMEDAAARPGHLLWLRPHDGPYAQGRGKPPNRNAA